MPPYREPVWMPDGVHIGFDHEPLVSVSYDRKTGNVRYQWIDSLAGWWVVKTDGTDLHRHLATYLPSPAVSAPAEKILITLPSKLGYQLFTMPLVGGLPDAAGFTHISTPNEAAQGRWSPNADSLLYLGVGFNAGGTWVVAANGGGAHWVDPQLTYPDWHPSARKVVGVVNTDSAGAHISRILEYDLDSGESHTVLCSTSLVYRAPRYSPAGMLIALVQGPGSGGYAELWLVHADGTEARRLVPPPVVEQFTWSPSGNEIAYVKHDFFDFTLANGTVWVVNVASGVTRQLTKNP